MFLIDIMDVVAGLEIQWLLQCRLWLPSMWLESETEDATGTWKLTELMHTMNYPSFDALSLRFADLVASGVLVC
jgi:hypothetical protein